MSNATHKPAPLALICELTHRCPLRCTYCSNPVELQKASAELKTDEWQQALRQAAELGVLHAHFTGGEPLVRPDAEELVRTAHDAGLYTNLITSGVGLTDRRLDELERAGLDHFQLSFQDSGPEIAAEITGVDVHDRKVKLAKRLSDGPFAFTVNMVVHRKNLDHIEELIDFAVSFGPQRIEIANVQYYGWALENRALLMPTREQTDRCITAVANARERLKGKVNIDFVIPDYYGRYPKACMGGWGRQILLIDPVGDALPCHAAKVLPGMRFDNVRSTPLAEIWHRSEALEKYRGEEWMEEPCRSCERRGQDFGGCRCQAYMLTGRAEATDPVCSLSPNHALVTSELPEHRQELVQVSVGSNGDEASGAEFRYRVNPR